MNRLQSIALITGLLTAWCLSARADGDRHWQFTLAPGYTIPAYSTSDTRRPSPSIDASMLWGWKHWVSFGPEVGYVTGMPNKGTFQRGTSFTSDINTTLFHATGEIRIGPTIGNPDGPQFKPYIMGGGGYYNTHSNSGNFIVQTGQNSALLFPQGATTDHNAGWNGGAGMEWVFGNASLGLDARFHNVIYGSVKDDQYFTPSLRIGYAF